MVPSRQPTPNAQTGQSIMTVSSNILSQGLPLFYHLRGYLHESHPGPRLHRHLGDVRMESHLRRCPHLERRNELRLPARIRRVSSMKSLFTYYSRGRTLHNPLSHPLHTQCSSLHDHNSPRDSARSRQSKMACKSRLRSVNASLKRGNRLSPFRFRPETLPREQLCIAILPALQHPVQAPLLPTTQLMVPMASPSLSTAKYPEWHHIPTCHHLCVHL